MLSDWTTDLVNMTAFLDVVTPLQSTGTLRLRQSAFGGRYFVSPTPGSSYTKGLEHGRLRTLMRFSHNTTEYMHGLACLASTATLATLTTGSCYVAWFTSGTVVTLSRVAANNLGTTTTLRTVTYANTVNTLYAFQLEWRVNQGPQNATWLAVSIGTTADFSNLTLVMTHSDATASKLSSGNFEGIAGVANSSTLITVDYDQTELRSLTP